jgi:hypothetical protein
MNKAIQKIILFTAVVIVTGHCLLPHIHDNNALVISKNIPFKLDIKAHGHQHSIFTFSGLDENFRPSQIDYSLFQTQLNWNFIESLSFELQPVSNVWVAHSKTVNDPVKNDNYTTRSYLRGPPTA